MGIEIERKFLLRDARWRAEVSHAVRMCQGYLASRPECSVRVRIEGEDARLNIKSATLGIERREFEYAIPRADAELMLAELCGGHTLSKTRHYVPRGGHVFEIDEFDGANAGLVVAEVELAHADETFERPDWLGEEVSHDRRYYNVCLLERPYICW
ncbi:MAG: CYTH domain-containing protein [Gammaproteobacteria bacterium]